MTDLLILLPSDRGRSPSSSLVRSVLREGNATLASFSPPRVRAGSLEKSQFRDWHHQYGVDFTRVDPDFRLREIILLRTARSSLPYVSIPIFLWNHPSSTFSIDSVRLPHWGTTDPRNNPAGKNPGNIWSFSLALDDGSRTRQLQLLPAASGERLGNGSIEIDALDRLILCHSDRGDRVYVWGRGADLAAVERLCLKRHREFVELEDGDSDPLSVVSIPRRETPIPTPDLDATGEISVRGGTDVPPPASYFICDCRYGIKHVDFSDVEDVVTSPPYNIGYSPFNVPKPLPRTGVLSSPDRSGYSDELPREEYFSLLESTLSLIDEKLNSAASDVFVNMKNSYGGGECDPPFWLLHLVPRAWKLSDLLVWRYDISFDPARRKYKPYYEWVLRFTKGRIYRPRGHRYLRDAYIPILKGNASERRDLVHPAIFPRRLVERCLTESGHRGLVLDPFLGSGTALAAARGMGRPSIGFERRSEYVADIENRLGLPMAGRRNAGRTQTMRQLGAPHALPQSRPLRSSESEQ